MQKTIYPEKYFTQGHEAMLANDTSCSTMIYWLIIFLMMGGLASLFFIKIDISIKALGSLRPMIDKIELKSINSGLVDSVFVQNDCKVIKGKPILKLSSQNKKNRIFFYKEQKSDILLNIHDLEQLSELRNENINLSINQIKSINYRNEFKEFASTVKNNEMKEDNKKREFDNLKTLYDKKLKSFDEYEKIKNELAEISKQKKDEIDKKINKWQNDLIEKKNSLKQYELQINEATEEIRGNSIISPLSGTIEDFKIMPGDYLQTNQSLAMISPDLELIAEMYVSPKDIGLLNRNMQVQLLFDAFDYNYWGKVRGVIISIADDFIVIDKQPVYKIKCSLEKKYLSLKNGAKGNLKKGMTFRASFIVSNRSLWNILFDNVNNWIDPRI